MPRALRRLLESKVPHIKITSAESLGPVVHLKGQLDDLGEDVSVAHFGQSGTFYASVKASDTPRGKTALARFNGAFGSGSEEPMMVHRGGGDLGHEYWSRDIHDVMVKKREEMIPQMGRRVLKRAYRKPP